MIRFNIITIAEEEQGEKEQIYGLGVVVER